MNECSDSLPIDEHGCVNWLAPIERFSGLSPSEIVALSRLDRRPGRSVNPYLDSLVFRERDPVRLIGVLAAFMDSPSPADRLPLAMGIPAELLDVGHRDPGMEMWDRLLRDEDEEVRFHAYDLLRDSLDAAVPRSERKGWPHPDGPQGFYAVALADEQGLQKEDSLAPLTRQDAYNLMLSHAYAENGDYFNLGRAALAKLQAAQPPAS